VGRLASRLVFIEDYFNMVLDHLHRFSLPH